jgi:hypothetical protein
VVVSLPDILPKKPVIDWRNGFTQGKCSLIKAETLAVNCSPMPKAEAMKKPTIKKLNIDIKILDFIMSKTKPNIITYYHNKI